MMSILLPPQSEASAAAGLSTHAADLARQAFFIDRVAPLRPHCRDDADAARAPVRAGASMLTAKPAAPQDGPGPHPTRPEPLPAAAQSVCSTAASPGSGSRSVIMVLLATFLCDGWMMRVSSVNFGSMMKR